ncbi:uncharacterized protein LOC136031969 isoform X2 [Artemia franciscana]
MDGAPVRGESIPICVFLSGYDLTPTIRDIAKKFSVRYYLNLVLVDAEEIFQATGPNVFTENETIAKYAIMDRAPVRGESIPIRVFLSGYDLTPTMRDIAKKFSVRYYLNLVLVDEEEIFQATGNRKVCQRLSRIVHVFPLKLYRKSLNCNTEQQVKILNSR